MALTRDGVLAAMHNVLVPDTAVVKQAEKVLIKYLKKPAIIPILVEVLQVEANDGVRQMAALFLRARINRMWIRFTKPQQEQMKKFFLSQLMKEPKRPVRRAIAGLCGALAKQLLHANQWPEFTIMLGEAARAPDAGVREVSMFLLTNMCEALGEVLVPLFGQLKGILAPVMKDPSLPVRTQAIKAFGIIIALHGASKEALIFADLVPDVITSLHMCMAAHEEHAARMILCVLSDMAETSQPFLATKADKGATKTIEILLSIMGQNAEVVDNSTRDSASLVLMNLVEMYPKPIGAKWSKAILETCFKLGLMYDVEEETEREALSTQQVHSLGTTPYNIAGITVDKCAEYFMSKHFAPPFWALVLPHLDPAAPVDWKRRRVALAFLYAASEGLQVQITDQFKPVLDKVLPLARHENWCVREGVCMTLGQFSENVDAATARHHAEIMPVILALTRDPHPKVVSKATYALYALVDELEASDLGTYLAAVMAEMSRLAAHPDIRVQEYCVQVLGVMAINTGSAFAPYFENVCRGFIPMMNFTEPERVKLRGCATEALSQCIKAVGRPTCDGVLKAVIPTITDGFDLENAALDERLFLFFGNLASVLCNDFETFAADFVDFALTELMSTSGVDVDSSDSDLETSGMSQLAVRANFEEDDVQYDEQAALHELYPGKPLNFHFHTPNLDLKCSALHALAQVAEFCPVCVLPKADKIMSDCSSLLSHFHSEIRQNAVVVLEKLTITAIKADQAATGADSPGAAAGAGGGFAGPVRTIINECYHAVTTRFPEERERVTVSRMFDFVNHTVAQGGAEVLRTYLPQTFSMCDAVMKERAVCQKYDSDDDEDDPDDHDYIVFDVAADTVGLLAQEFKGAFVEPWRGMYRDVIKFTRESRTDADFSTAVGIFAEVAVGIGSAMAPFIPECLPIVLRGLKSSHSASCQNSCYATGVLVEACPAECAAHVGAAMAALKEHLKHPVRKVVDNALGAIARILIASMRLRAGPSAAGAVMKEFAEALPVKEDHSEDEVVYKCVMTMLVTKDPAALAVLPQLLSAFAQILPDGSGVDPAIRGSVAGMLNKLGASLGPAFREAVQLLPAPMQAVLAAAAAAAGGAAPPASPASPAVPPPPLP